SAAGQLCRVSSVRSEQQPSWLAAPSTSPRQFRLRGFDTRPGAPRWNLRLSLDEKESMSWVPSNRMSAYMLPVLDLLYNLLYNIVKKTPRSCSMEMVERIAGTLVSEEGPPVTAAPIYA